MSSPTGRDEANGPQRPAVVPVQAPVNSDDEKVSRPAESAEDDAKVKAFERQRQESFTSQVSARLKTNRTPSYLHRAGRAVGPQGVTFKPRRPSHSEIDGWGGKTPKGDLDCSSGNEDALSRHSTLSTAAHQVPALDPDLEAQVEQSESRLFPKQANLKTYLFQEVPHNHFLEAQLMLLTFGTGIIDATTYVSYRCFVSKQTGNAVMITLWANKHAQVSGGVEANVGFSMMFFILGSAFFGHIGHLVKQRRRLWLLFSNFIQAVVVMAATAIIWTVPHGDVGVVAVAVVSMLAFAMGGQISLALCVKLPELNTTMITGTLIQLSTDRKIFKLYNSARNRRVFFFVALIAGAFVGAAISQYYGVELSILIFGIVKVLAMFSFLFNHGLVGVKKDQPASGTVTPLNRILWGD